MAELLGGEFKFNETNKNSRGGTETLTQQLGERLGKDILQDFQIVSSRVRELDEDKIRIFWAHDLPNDPESHFLKTKEGQNKFHKFVFVSNWQMNGYMQAYNLPWSKCQVMPNAIDPIEDHEKPDTKDGINLIYHTTPHRGLNILSAVFKKLCETYDNLNLDIFSSFELYGWKERDDQFKELFQQLEEMKNVKMHGTQPNSVVREHLKKTHIFPYPSVWPETSCLCLIEAMSAGCVNIHPNYAALFETAAQFNQMYQMHEDQSMHASMLYAILDGNIKNIESSLMRARSARSYANLYYNWETRTLEWKGFLENLKQQIKDRSLPQAVFSYDSTR